MTDYPGRPFTRTRARLRVRLEELLDDGTGRVRPELQPLADSLLAMPKLDRALNWLHNNVQLPDYLQALARGDIPVTHDGLHGLASWRTAAHLRDLLMACGALPAVDRQILLFEGWTRRRLEVRGADDHDTRLLRQFLAWHQLPQLHAAARRAPLSPGLAVRGERADHPLALLDRGERQPAGELLVAPAGQHRGEDLLLWMQQRDAAGREQGHRARLRTVVDDPH